jgi:hypothetical protein
MIAPHSPALPASDAPKPPSGRMAFEQFGRTEKLLLSYAAILVELFLIVALQFGYPGVILFAEIGAVSALVSLVIVTATGLR